MQDLEQIGYWLQLAGETVRLTQGWDIEGKDAWCSSYFAKMASGDSGLDDHLDYNCSSIPCSYPRHHR